MTAVIPTYNRLPLLLEAIASVQAQTWPHWELVVADDGSTDGSAQAVAALGDARIRWLPGEHSGHLGRVRNRGVAAGSGELIAFLDSDDVWEPRRLELQIAALAASGARWSFSDGALMGPAQEPLRGGVGIHRPRSGWIADALLRDEMGVPIGSLLVERSLFDEVGGFDEHPRLTRRGDLELVLRLALRAPACALDEVLVRIREHPGRITRAVHDPHARAALVYERFLRQPLPLRLRLLAHRARLRALRGGLRMRLRRWLRRG